MNGKRIVRPVQYGKLTGWMVRFFNVIGMRNSIFFVLIVVAFISACEEDIERDDLNVDLTTLVKGKVDTGQTFFSAALDRDMNYSIYFPPGYDTTSVDYPILYLLHGMWGNYLDWVNNGMESIVNTAIKNETAKHMVIVMPDGLDAFYCNNYSGGSMMYEDFFIDEFIPYIESTYRIKSNRANRAIAGLSMGGYGTTFHSFKRPEMFSAAYSMSGALDMGTSAPSLTALIESMTEEELAGLPAYAMECGTEDLLVYQSNVDFDIFLTDKGVAHEYIQRSGTHDWVFWKACLPKALTLASEQFD